MRSARLGLALSVLLALSGSAAAASRMAAGNSATPLAAGTIGRYACHDTIHLAHVADTNPAPVVAGSTALAAPATRPSAPSTARAPGSVVSAPTTIAPSVDRSGACHPTSEQVAVAQKLVDDTRASIGDRYRSVSRATLDGFQLQNDDSVHTRVMHYGNQANLSDGRTPDPSAPEGLLYGRTDHHGVVLLGAFYATDPGKAPPDVAGCLTPWHVHAPGAAAMLHVWIVDMPGGPFTADMNPNYIAGL